MEPRIKITFKSLGQHRGKDRKPIYGLALGHWEGTEWKPTGEIVLDPKYKGKEMIDSVVHEWLHIRNPKMSERKVKWQAEELAAILYDEMKLRRIEE